MCIRILWESNIIKPFLKWAGGKSQLIEIIRRKYPNNIDNYCEPFIGAGAILFDILNYKKPKKILINDINNNFFDNLYSNFNIQRINVK